MSQGVKPHLFKNTQQNERIMEQVCEKMEFSPHEKEMASDTNIIVRDKNHTTIESPIVQCSHRTLAFGCCIRLANLVCKLQVARPHRPRSATSTTLSITLSAIVLQSSAHKGHSLFCFRHPGPSVGPEVQHALASPYNLERAWVQTQLTSKCFPPQPSKRSRHPQPCHVHRFLASNLHAVTISEFGESCAVSQFLGTVCADGDRLQLWSTAVIVNGQNIPSVFAPRRIPDTRVAGFSCRQNVCQPPTRRFAKQVSVSPAASTEIIPN